MIEPDQADLVLVNTCTVTSRAASDSRQIVRQAACAGVNHVILTGCWSTMEPKQAADLPNVRKIISNQDKDHLVQILEREEPALFDIEPIQRMPLEGLRLRTRAFIKVQDGCDNHCTFCITTLARGRSRSRPAVEIIDEIRDLQSQGVKEFVLTGVHLGSWGQDGHAASSLHHLVTQILDRANPARLRLSSLEPWDVTPEFFKLWQDTRLCPHFHLPVQSGSDSILRKMARRGSTKAYLGLVDSLRKAVPDVALSTDIIVGFPGETEAEFEQSLEFARRVGFSDGHVFSFSPRPGTVAARMKDQIPARVIKDRSQAMQEVLKASRQAYLKQFFHRDVTVLWEASPEVNGAGWIWNGLTGHNVRVKAQSTQHLWNQLSKVHINHVDDYYLRGDIIPSSEAE